MSQRPAGWTVPVLAVQRALIAIAMLPVRDPVTGKPNDDGWRGDRTDAAVRRVQTRARLPATGVVDQATWAAIQSLPIRLPRQGPPSPPTGPAPDPAPDAMIPTPQAPGSDDKPGAAGPKAPSFLELVKSAVKENPGVTTAVAVFAIGAAIVFHETAPNPPAIVIREKA